MTNYRLMQVKSIAECSKGGGGGILQYVQPSLSYHLSLRSVFCLFLGYRFTQVLLYGTFIVEKTKIIVGKVTFNAIYQRHRKSMAPYWHQHSLPPSSSKNLFAIFWRQYLHQYYCRWPWKNKKKLLRLFQGSNQRWAGWVYAFVVLCRLYS